MNSYDHNIRGNPLIFFSPDHSLKYFSTGKKKTSWPGFEPESSSVDTTARPSDLIDFERMTY